MTIFELVHKLNNTGGNMVPSMWVMVQGSSTASLGVGVDTIASVGVNADGTVRSIIMRKNATVEQLQRIKNQVPGVEIKGV